MTDRASSTVQRIGAAADQAGLDAVLLLGLENVQHAAGAPLRSASALDRPNVVLIDRNGAGTVFTSEETVDTVGLMTTGLQVLGYDERGALFPRGIIDRVVTELNSRGLTSARIGYESDRMVVAVHELISESMTDVELVPFDAELRRSRMVKQPADLDTIAEAARLTENALAQTIRTMALGDTERQVADRLIGYMQAAGFSNVDPLVGGGPNAARIGPPTDRPIEVGDWVRLDVKSRYRGFLYTDAGRMAVVGEPTGEQHAAYRRQYELNLRIIDFLRPGRRCGDVYRYAQQQAGELGAELFNYGHIGIGHGIGVGGTERPVLHERDEVILEPGMVINIEPDTYGPGREILHIEDMLLITEGATEPLSHRDDWSKLRSIGAA